MKIITICGSLKYQNEMMDVAEKLALKGNCVLTPVYPVNNNERTENQLKSLKEEHLKSFCSLIHIIGIINYFFI